MSSNDPNLASIRSLVQDTVRGADFRRATFAGAPRWQPACPWARVVVRPVELRGEAYLQFSYFDATKDISKNYRSDEIEARLDELIAIGFAGIHLTTVNEEIDIRTTKKGAIHVGRRGVKVADATPSARHDRVKDVPLPEGRANRLLEALGVQTRDGHIRPRMRAKFTQINEFLAHLAHAIDDANLRSLGRPLEILDCGCGSSYLTLAAHHYLNDVLSVPARLIGVDVNEEVIRKSMARAERWGSDHVAFECGPIDAAAAQPDVVLALHACDTATDDALARAVAAEARVVLSVPCCHHDLNERLRPTGGAEALRPLLRHGILHQRTADLVTDAFRALALRIVGYRADVIEFVSAEHTARNLMIRAIRGAAIGEPRFVREYLDMRRFWGTAPYIEGALGEPFRQLLATHEAGDMPCGTPSSTTLSTPSSGSTAPP